ncbi:phosphopantetheine-binding protein [Streptomyces violascens]|uniref:phosphopantetheine-binding protein n=1 Tax=Streptomyces violascens TaxID=67381 RepID=UPI0036585FC1
MNPPWDSTFEELVTRHADLDQEPRLRPGDDLFARGLDSIAIVELVVSLEETYAIEIPDEHLTQETFATPAVLWAAVDALVRDSTGRKDAA